MSHKSKDGREGGNWGIKTVAYSMRLRGGTSPFSFARETVYWSNGRRELISC